MLFAAGLGAASVVAGLLLSYHLDIAAGAAIVLVAVGLFFVVFALRGARRVAPAGAPE
jgi:ABC-type Mn2+/Zn2+ transport system permease subunit